MGKEVQCFCNNASLVTQTFPLDASRLLFKLRAHKRPTRCSSSSLQILTHNNAVSSLWHCASKACRMYITCKCRQSRTSPGVLRPLRRVKASSRQEPVMLLETRFPMFYLASAGLQGETQRQRFHVGLGRCLLAAIGLESCCFINFHKLFGLPLL